MSGHSKWSNIKFRKERQDAKKSKVFTKLIKEITIAAREGGGDADANPRLRTAIQAAKTANLPLKNVENAIQKGTGELPGMTLEEVVYEGYGPGGVALYVICATENRNRTVGNIRHLMSKYGGNLGESGCVGWMFDRKGLIRVLSESIDEESLLLSAIEAGAEDLVNEGEVFEIYTPFEELNAVRNRLEEAGIEIEGAEVAYIPQTNVPLEGKKAEQMLKLMDALENDEDVQNVFANFDIDDEVMESLNI